MGTHKITKQRKRLLASVKAAYLEHVGDPTAKGFFQLSGDIESQVVTGFKFGTQLTEFEKAETIFDMFVTSLIPNNIVGSLATAKVIILNLNMGVGKDSEAFFERLDNDYVYNPTNANHGIGKKFSRSQTTFHEAFNTKPQLRAVVDKILKRKYKLDKAQDLVNEMRRFYLKPAKVEAILTNYQLPLTTAGYETLSNFYRLIVLPLLQLKFPFEKDLLLPPLSLATEPYFVPIDDQPKLRYNILQVDPDEYSWDGENAWTKYVYGGETLPLLGPATSLLASLGITNLAEIMFLQQYPYASKSFDRPRRHKEALEATFAPWLSFMTTLISLINEYNRGNETDQIKIIYNRIGTKYLAPILAQAPAGTVYQRHNTGSSRSGQLRTSEFMTPLSSQGGAE